jgi:hypothetical protein
MVRPRLPKPDFDPPRSFWRDPETIPAALRGELVAMIPAGWEASQIDVFMTCCSEQVQLLVLSRTRGSPAAAVQAELRAVEGEALRLLHVLRRLSPGAIDTLRVYWRDLPWIADSPVAVSPLGAALHAHEGRALGGVWDLVCDLAGVAEFSAAQFEPSRQARPRTDLARALVEQVADAHHRIKGRFPTYSKDTWFPAFMEHLCAWPVLDLRCGQSMVQAAVKGRTPPV